MKTNYKEVEGFYNNVKLETEEIIVNAKAVAEETVIYAKDTFSNIKATVVVGVAAGYLTALEAAPIAAPDMSDATTSVTNVFGAVLGVAVLIFGFKKIKSLL